MIIIIIHNPLSHYGDYTVFVRHIGCGSCLACAHTHNTCTMRISSNVTLIYPTISSVNMNWPQYTYVCVWIVNMFIFKPIEYCMDGFTIKKREKFWIKTKSTNSPRNERWFLGLFLFHATSNWITHAAYFGFNFIFVKIYVSSVNVTSTW